MHSVQWVREGLEVEIEVGRLILIPTPVLHTWYRYRQVSKDAPEAGGMILGRQRGEHFEIYEITTPQLGDKCSRRAFTREDGAHLEYAVSLWRQSEGFIGHIGEWHTHPCGGAVHPSGIDEKEWHLLSEENADVSVFVIIGEECVYLRARNMATRYLWCDLGFPFK